MLWLNGSSAACLYIYIYIYIYIIYIYIYIYLRFFSFLQIIAKTNFHATLSINSLDASACVHACRSVGTGHNGPGGIRSYAHSAYAQTCSMPRSSFLFGIFALFFFEE